MIVNIFFNRSTGIHQVTFEYSPTYSIPKSFRPVDSNVTNGGLARGTSIGNYHGPRIEKIGGKEVLILDNSDMNKLLSKLDRMDIHTNMYGVI